MDLHLKDKVVIVTGGASGIGAAISLTLAEEGAIPVILGKSPMSPEFAQQLQAKTAQHLFVQVELSDDAACRAAVEQTVARFGRIDGLVNNAGVNDSIGLEAGAGPFLGFPGAHLFFFFTFSP